MSKELEALKAEVDQFLADYEALQGKVNDNHKSIDLNASEIQQLNNQFFAGIGWATFSICVPFIVVSLNAFFHRFSRSASRQTFFPTNIFEGSFPRASCNHIFLKKVVIWIKSHCGYTIAENIY